MCNMLVCYLPADSFRDHICLSALMRNPVDHKAEDF